MKKDREGWFEGPDIGVPYYKTRPGTRLWWTGAARMLGAGLNFLKREGYHNVRGVISLKKNDVSVKADYIPDPAMVSVEMKV